MESARVGDYALTEMPDGADAYPAYSICTCRPDKRQRHRAKE
ncbi:hypothetical protein SEEJ0721_08157 [Salmonella enterica subsp. enterica serovar Javiana str. 10721]|nr:hypothetical protein SEEJ0721_08157 [Salmonella enterica subsp. enterica serovar Javiana str. 10721]